MASGAGNSYTVGVSKWPYLITAVVLAALGMIFFYYALFFIAGPELFTVSRDYRRDYVDFVANSIPSMITFSVAWRFYRKARRLNRAERES